jgi:hypothetical protein
MRHLNWTLMIAITSLSGSLFAACLPQPEAQGSLSLQRQGAQTSASGDSLSVKLLTQLLVGKPREVSKSDESWHSCRAVILNNGTRAIPAASYVLKPVKQFNSNTQSQLVTHAEGYTRVDYKNADLYLEFMVSWDTDELDSIKEEAQVRKMNRCIPLLLSKLKSGV